MPTFDTAHNDFLFAFHCFRDIGYSSKNFPTPCVSGAPIWGDPIGISPLSLSPGH